MIYVIAGSEEDFKEYLKNKQLQLWDATFVNNPAQLEGLEIEEQYLHATQLGLARSDKSALFNAPKTLTPPQQRYFMKEKYIHRSEARQSTTEVKIGEECQKEVYDLALEIFQRYGLKSVMDVGCGGALKLINRFGKLKKNNLLGMDTPETFKWLLQKYPKRMWVESPVMEPVADWRIGKGDLFQGFDLMICADVIEHLAEPDNLMAFVLVTLPEFIVLSTPNRDLLQEMFADGPPRNPAHYREWTHEEFSKYTAYWLHDEYDVVAVKPVDGSGQALVLRRLEK